MTKLEQNTTNDIGGFAIFISRALKKIPPIIGMLAVLSLGQTNFSPLIGGDLGIFASPAEARVIRHRPVHHPVHRPVHRNVHVHRVAVIRPIPRVRPWYWGRVVAGVTVGTVIAVSAVGAVPVAPSSELCWYWASASKTRGYWNYCTPPAP